MQLKITNIFEIQWSLLGLSAVSGVCNEPMFRGPSQLSTL